MQNTFKAMAADWEPMVGISNTMADAAKAFSSSPAMLALSGLSESLKLGSDSAAAELTKALTFPTALALAEGSTVTAMLDRLRTSALDQFGSLDTVSRMEPASVLQDFDFARYDVPLLDFDLPVGNPLLDSMIELTQTNAESHRRLEEMTVLTRELRDEVASLRQAQIEADKGAQTWVRLDVGVALAALIVAIVALMLTIA